MCILHIYTRADVNALILWNGVLYVIKLDFEMLNAIFFNIFDKNALIRLKAPLKCTLDDTSLIKL